jgi:hypothetical protein
VAEPIPPDLEQRTREVAERLRRESAEAEARFREWPERRRPILHAEIALERAAGYGAPGVEEEAILLGWAAAWAEAAAAVAAAGLQAKLANLVELLAQEASGDPVTTAALGVVRLAAHPTGQAEFLAALLDIVAPPEREAIRKRLYNLVREILDGPAKAQAPEPIPQAQRLALIRAEVERQRAVTQSGLENPASLQAGVDALWQRWRQLLPESPPPACPRVETVQAAQDAFDALLRELQTLQASGTDAGEEAPAPDGSSDAGIEPPPPESIKHLPDPVTRERAREAWLAAYRLRACIDAWGHWWLELRAARLTPGTADLLDQYPVNPALPLQFYEVSCQCIHALCSSGVNSTTFLQNRPDEIIRWLPKIASGRLRPQPWYLDDEFYQSFFGEAHERLTGLQGELLHLMNMLRNFPAAALVARGERSLGSEVVSPATSQEPAFLAGHAGMAQEGNNARSPQQPAPSDALARVVERERKLHESIARADRPVYAFGVGATRRWQIVDGQIVPVGPPVLLDVSASLKADTLGDLLRSLKLIEDAHQSNEDAVAELRQLSQKSPEEIVPRDWPPDRRAAALAGWGQYQQQARVKAEQQARMVTPLLKAWHERLESFPGVGRLRRLVQAEGLAWGRAAVVSLRARLCIAREKEEEWADALPVQEAADLLSGGESQEGEWFTATEAVHFAKVRSKVELTLGRISKLSRKEPAPFKTRKSRRKDAKLEVHVASFAEFLRREYPTRKAEEDGSSADRASVEEAKERARRAKEQTQGNLD